MGKIIFFATIIKSTLIYSCERELLKPVMKRLFLLSVLLLASCAAPKNSENKVKQLAVDTALAYFTFDYENVEEWMQPVQGDFYYKNHIEEYVLPVLAPYLQEYYIKSNAELVSVEEYSRGSSSDGAQVVIWKITLQVDMPWPKKGPPSPFGPNERDEIPWTKGERAIVYGAAAYQLGVWNVKLLAKNEADALVTELTLE